MRSDTWTMNDPFRINEEPDDSAESSGRVVTESSVKAFWLCHFCGHKVERVTLVPVVGPFGQVKYRKKRVLVRRVANL